MPSPSVTLLSTYYTTITLAALRTRIRERLFASFWTDTELTAYVREALRIWNTLTGYWRQAYSLNVGAGTIFFNVNETVPNHMALLRIEMADTHLELTSLAEMDDINPGWQNDASATLRQAAPIGLDQIALNPPAAVDTNIIVYSIRTAPLPVMDADVIQMGEEDIIAIIDYVQFAASIKEGTSEMQTAMSRFQNFLAQASKYNSKLNTISIYRRLLGTGGQKLARPASQERLSTRGA